MVQNFFNIVNDRYKQISKTTLAQTMFKKSVDIGSAIVNIVGNTGIAGFKFHCPMREEIEMASEATDHYLDNNNPVQDHIIQKPVIINLQGFQGDYFYSVNQIEDTLALITPTLSLVKQFLPELTEATKQIKATSFFNKTNSYKLVDGVLTTSIQNDVNFVDLFRIFQDLYKLTSAQTRAFFFLEALWRSKALMTVETTWKRYDNMVITNVKPIRDENLDITDFRVSFKQIYFTSSNIIDLDNAAGRTRQQLAAVSKKGIDKGQEVTTI